jgi:hypothetical protein
MQNPLKMILAPLLLLAIVSPTHAYIYTFPNHTEHTYAIAIQFIGEDQPLYKRLIHPHTIETFGDGEGGVPEIKEGFCLAHIYYVKEPTSPEKKRNFENAPWREIPISWVQLDTYHALLEAVKPRPTIKKRKRVPVAQTVRPPLSPLIKPIKPAQRQTLCIDRRFEIVEDEHGKVFIISPLAQP